MTDRPTDRQTDRPRYSVCNNMCIYVCSTAMQPNHNTTIVLWCCYHDHSHCKSSPGYFDKCRASARWLPTVKSSQPTTVSLLVSGCYHPHPPSPFVTITQRKSSYSFYCLTEGGRLSRPRHCSKGVQAVPKVVYCSGCLLVINTTAHGEI